MGARLQRVGKLALRVASAAVGGFILKHEVYDTESAEIIVIALGLWFIGVPPALWLDTVVRTKQALEPRDPGKSD